MEPRRVIVTTGESVPGYEIEEYLGLVWGASVKARFIGHDIIAVFKTIIGGEVEPYTKMTNEARMDTIRKIVANARKLKADAVIGFRMSTSQVIPGTIEVLGYGTAVKLKKKRR